MKPDDERLAEAARRAAFIAEHSLEHSNRDASRELALDILCDWVEGHPTHTGDEEVAWALKLVEGETTLREHEQRIREEAWQKIKDDAEQDRWERLGLRR